MFSPRDATSLRMCFSFTFAVRPKRFISLSHRIRIDFPLEYVLSVACWKVVALKRLLCGSRIVYSTDYIANEIQIFLLVYANKEQSQKTKSLNSLSRNLISKMPCSSSFLECRQFAIQTHHPELTYSNLICV